MAELKVVALDKIRIPEIRVSSVLDTEQRALLQSTIQEIGVVQDIVVRALSADEYELIAGKSRLEELRTLGFKEIQVKVVGADEKLGLIMNIVENVARGNYEYVSISQAIRKLRALGATPEELERIFPWKRRWIQFIEELQDLPSDVIEGLRAGKLTPTHVQIATDLPTPYEAHDGLKTAINLGWDTGTFKVYVDNRRSQIEAARQKAAAQGVEPVIPPAVPNQLIQYKQCLLCGFKKPVDQVTVQLVCTPCVELVQYITGQLGPAEDAIKHVYAALQAYAGRQQLPAEPAAKPEAGSSQA